MGDEERNARWHELMGVQQEFQREDGRPVNGSSRRRKPSRRAAQFDAALSGWDGWSTPEAPRRRLSA